MIKGQVAAVFQAGCVLLLAGGCDNFVPQPVEFSQQDIVTVGNVRTLEINGQVLSSLPESAPLVDDKQAALGRLLFWDPILSGDQDVACATCHLPEAGYTDAQHQSIGVGGIGRADQRVVGHTGRVARNAQSVLNTAWSGISELGLFESATAPMFWDNRTVSLEAQALEPIRSRQEMRGDNFTVEQIETEVVERLNANSLYLQAFAEAFATDTIQLSHVAEALANFQRTLVANQSAFDRWMRGEPEAMTEQQISGMQEFVLAGCAECHSGPMFSDFDTHILSVREGSDVLMPDVGAGDFAFRTPTLRQLAFTGPYFHAGQFATLNSAINFYHERQSSDNPNVPSSAMADDLRGDLDLDDGRDNFIQAFLNALNDESFDRLEPESVPSGLPVGGF